MQSPRRPPWVTLLTLRTFLSYTHIRNLTHLCVRCGPGCDRLLRVLEHVARCTRESQAAHKFTTAVVTLTLMIFW